MADPNFKKISDMAEKTTIGTNDFVPIADMDEPADVNKNKKIKTSNLRKDILTSEMKDGQVTSGKLANGSVIAGKIATGGVSAAAQLASDVVETAKIKNLNVTTDKLAAEAVTHPKIKGLGNPPADDDRIAFWDYSASSLGYLDLGTGLAISGTTLNAANIGSGDIANGAVTNEKIANDAVTSAKIADNSINSEHYVDGSIDQEHLSVGASKVTNRQGGMVTSGSATNWSVGGNTNYALSSVRIQVGSFNITVEYPGNQQVTYPVAFSQVPVLIISGAYTTENNGIYINTQTATGFSCSCVSPGVDPLPMGVQWIAIGAA